VGGWPGSRTGIGVFIALLFLPRPASGHTPGLSVAEFTVAADGHVDGRITFASAEALNGTPLRDEDLEAFLMDGVEVTADGGTCDGTFGGSSVTENDGLLLEARYACPPGASVIAVTLYYLNALGSGHREVARIVAPGFSAEGLLTRDRRALSLRLPSTPHVARRSAKKLVAAGAALAVALVALALWLRKTRRRA
jgi:hypothetical protein